MHGAPPIPPTTVRCCLSARAIAEASTRGTGKLSSRCPISRWDNFAYDIMGRLVLFRCWTCKGDPSLDFTECTLAGPAGVGGADPRGTTPLSALLLNDSLRYRGRGRGLGFSLMQPISGGPTPAWREIRVAETPFEARDRMVRIPCCAIAFTGRVLPRSCLVRLACWPGDCRVAPLAPSA